MGLLDFFNYNNSGLKEFADNGLSGIRNTMANTPKMYDPHANAKALMGGQPMQYNQQPQSLIADAQQNTNQVSNAPTNITPQQTQQITYGSPVGPNMGQVNTETSEVSSYDDSNGYDPTQVIQRNPAINQPMVGSLLMGNAQQQQGFEAPDEKPTYTTQVDNTDYSQQGVNSITPVVAQQYPAMDFGTAFKPTMTDERRRLIEESRARLPWYLGGTGGK